MDNVRYVQILVAKLDLYLTAVIKWIGTLLFLLPLLIAFILILMMIRNCVLDKMYLIDYDKPYDITSEGPDDYNENWNDF